MGAVLSFYLATGRIRKQVTKFQVKSHSLSQYYGFYVCLWVLVPTVLLALIWMFAADPMLLTAAKVRLTEAYPKLPESFLNLKMAQLGNIAAGYIKAPDTTMAAQADCCECTDLGGSCPQSYASSCDVYWFFYSIRHISPKLQARYCVKHFCAACSFFRQWWLF